jgi:hypothetical protein
MNRKRTLGGAMAAAFSALFAVQPAAAAPRQPVGVYLHVDLQHLLREAGKEHAPQSEKDAFIRSTLTTLLATPAVSGVTLGLRWNTLEPGAPVGCPVARPRCQPSDAGYDWNDLDDAFAVVATMPGKTLQLILTPGFDAPQWLKNRLSPCDALFTGGSADWDCSSANFIDFPEQGRANQDQGSTRGDPTYTLPLPWAPTYKIAWQSFLTTLARHVHGQTALVAIQISGPIGASDEMILPATANGKDPKTGKFSVTQAGHVPADQAWTRLIANYDRAPSGNHPIYVPTSNQIFIDQWDQAIAGYDQTFSGLTLVLSPDAGNDFPTFGQNAITPHADNFLFAVDCAKDIALAKQGRSNFIVSCEAKTEVISSFVKTTAPDQRGTEVGGLTAASPLDAGDIGVAGSKLLTAPDLPLWPQPLAIAGAQFDHAASNLKDKEGCPGAGACPTDPEQATANVLKNLFYDTSVATHYGNAGNGAMTVSYVDVPAEDIQYAERQGCHAPAGETSMLQQLAAANADMFTMAGRTPPSQTGLCR